VQVLVLLGVVVNLAYVLDASLHCKVKGLPFNLACHTVILILESVASFTGCNLAVGLGLIP
jgi:hypothetical protein